MFSVVSKAMASPYQATRSVRFQATTPKTLAQIAQEFPREYGVAVYCGYSPIPGDPQCQLAERMGRVIGNTMKNSQRMFVVTGGGERTCNMGAVAYGAISVGSRALGVAIPFDGWTPPRNDYSEFVLHDSFSMRLYGEAGFEQCAGHTVVLPGGIGTSWEFMNKLQDLYCNHSAFASQRQIILVDHNNYFTGPNRLIPYLQTMVDDGMLKAEALKILKIVKTPEEVPAALLNADIAWTTPRHPDKSVLNRIKLPYFY